MGYKVLGFIVWKAGKFFLRRRLAGRKTMLMGAGGTLLAAGAAGAAVAVLRHRAAPS